MLLEITQPTNGRLSGALPKNVEDIIYAYSNGTTLWNPEIEVCARSDPTKTTHSIFIPKRI